MKLNQILAIEKGQKTRTYAETDSLMKVARKGHLLNGFSKVYSPKNEDGETYPPEKQIVQFRFEDLFKKLVTLNSEYFDTVARKDWANCVAKADIVVDGAVLLEGVPATYLLFLEKQLADLRKIVSEMVELDPAEDWLEDTSTGLRKTNPTRTQKTKKMQKPIVLYDATEHHPAQTQLITSDEVVGYWNTVKFSGAIPATEKQKILARIVKLEEAVKVAREKANLTEAPQKTVGDPLFSFIFAQ